MNRDQTVATTLHTQMPQTKESNQLIVIDSNERIGASPSRIQQQDTYAHERKTNPKIAITVRKYQRFIA